MGLFDVFKRSKETTVEEIIPEVKEEPSIDAKYASLMGDYQLKWLLEKIDIDIENPDDFKKIPKKFLDRCLDNDFRSLLIENSYLITPEILNKIIDNNLTLDDIDTNNLALISFIEPSERLEVLKNRSFEETDTEYCAINVSDDFTKEGKEVKKYIDSYIEGKKILISSQKVVELDSIYTNSDSIKILNKSDKHLCKEGYIVEDTILREDSIIVLTFERYKELSKDPKTLEILKTHQFIISDAFDDQHKLYHLNIDPFGYDNQDLVFSTDLIKYNHIVKIINESDLEESEKQYYLYMLYNASPFSIQNFIRELTSKVSSIEIDKITDSYNETSLEEKVKSKEVVDYTIDIFNYINPNFNELELHAKIIRLNMLSDRELRIVLSYPQIRDALEGKVQDPTDLYALKSLIERAEEVAGNEIVKDFVERQGLKIEDILSNNKYELQNQYDINPILGTYAIKDLAINEDVSIADIVGFAKGHIKGRTRNILDNFACFFKTRGDGYHTRSNSLLEFTNGETALRKLNGSFKHEPLGLSKYEDKYVVSENGLHRTIVLRFLYIKELLEGKLSEEELREKYKIPGCKVYKTNNEKTYIHYMLRSLDYDVKYVITSDNKDSLSVIYSGDRDETLLLEDLKERIRNKLTTCEDKYLIQEFKDNYKKYPSYKEFMDSNFPEYKLSDESEVINNGKSF